jgi:ribosome-associated toxin RatA of RatAB toxin-antitoxin module
MPRITIEATTAGRPPDAVFSAITDFERFPDVAEDIRSITVSREGPATVATEWVVAFRGGEMRWTQRDQLDRESRTVAFEMIEGDSDVWEGTWSVTSEGVRFVVDFDLGLPALADQLNPLAERALYDVIVAVLRGQVGADIEILTPFPG